MKVFFILLSFFILVPAIAQDESIISGHIIDQSTGEDIPFASISIRSATDELIHGSITDENGNFSIVGLAPGNYTIIVSYLGYGSYQEEILIGELNQYYDLGKVALKTSATQLEEVTVVGERAEIDAGLVKKSYNLQDNIAQSGGSVMDAMKAMPSVTFDQEGKVILRGSDKVIVLIDGQQSSLTGFGNQKGLDNIPAANIDRIEIINNPSAKYDARGMAGIINIIYKKEKQSGMNGSVGFDFGLGALSRRKADLPSALGSFSPTPKYIPSLDLNYKKEKLNLSLQSEILFQERLPNNEFSTRYYDDGQVIASQVPENRKQTHYIVKGGADFQFDEHNKLSISGIYDWESHVDSAQVPYINLETNTRNRYIHWNEEEITGFMNFLLHYEHQFQQNGHELHSHLQYSKGWEDETYFINDSSAIRTNGRDVTHVLGTEHTTSLSFDYTKPLRSGRLESGGRLQIRRLPVEFDEERGEQSIIYPGLGSWTKWGEAITVGYINWIHEKTKYTIEAGLRSEYTRVFYNIDKTNIYYSEDDAYDYFRLFPNVRVSYKFNDHHRMSLFYNHRIDRPGEPELRLFAKSDDHELVKVGNPYLRPQFTQSGEVGYKTSWDKGSAFISGYYRFIKDPYMRVYTPDTSNTDFDVVLKSYANTGEASNLGFEFIFNQEVTDNWKISANLNYYQNDIHAYTGTLLFPYRHTFEVEHTTDNTWDIKVINTLTLRDDWQIQLTGLYMAPKNIPQGRQLSRSSIDFGLKKKLWQGKGEFGLAITDIFNQFGLRQEIDSEGFSVDYENYYETQIIRSGIKYKF